MDVSGRGMHVRATHVPALSTPLVLRFQEHGSEIIGVLTLDYAESGRRDAQFMMGVMHEEERSPVADKLLV